MQRINYDDLKLHQAILEIRYSDGYRYWDVCGQTILDLKEASKGEIEFIGLQGSEECQLSFIGNPFIRASFGFKHITITASRHKNFNKMKNFSATMFSVVKKNIRFSRCERIGVRFKYVLPKQTAEDADEIIKKINIVQVDAERFKDFGEAVENIRPAVVVTNGDLKINVNIGSAHREGLDFPLDSEEEEYTPKNCLLIDFDYHKDNVDMTDSAVEQFIHSCHKNFQENISKVINIQ